MSQTHKYTVFIGVLIIVIGFGILYYPYTFKTNQTIILTKSISNNYDSNQIEYPSTSFFLNIGKYYQWMQQLQVSLDQAAKSRQGVIGNIAWHPTQLYYYARSASYRWVSNICEIGYGAGHSTLLYLSMNPKAHVYSFDLFPNNTDDKIHTPGETLAYQQAFQQVTLNSIINDKELNSRFHKIVGNSNTAVPKFIEENPEIKCDVISIDGSHHPPQPYFDMLHSQKFAHKQSIVLLDDMHDGGLKGDFKKAIQEGILSQYECLIAESRVDTLFSSTGQYHKEFCAARYQNVPDRQNS